MVSCQEVKQELSIIFLATCFILEKMGSGKSHGVMKSIKGGE
jgi:hypothetical protein